MNTCGGGDEHMWERGIGTCGRGGLTHIGGGMKICTHKMLHVRERMGTYERGRGACGCRGCEHSA
jgi:hypothetical protein